MKAPVHLQHLTDTQRQFVAAAESLGATAPARARSGGELPRLSARELLVLLDMGVVRESADGSYYVYPRARPAPELLPTPASATPPGRRMLKLVILLVMLALPWIFLVLNRGLR